MAEVISCAPDMHIGEQLALSYLRENLPDNNIILTNYHLPDRNRTLEIDLVVINLRGVFLLEVKHWTGDIVGDQIHWFEDERRQFSPLTTVDKKTKRVSSVLANAPPEMQQFGDLSAVSVVGMVVLSLPTPFTIDDPRQNRVFHLDERLVQALTGKEFLFASSSMPLKGPRLQAVKQALVRVHTIPKHCIAGNYRILTELAPGETYDAFEAQHLTIQGRRARLKRYHIPAIRSMRHLEETIREFKQDMEALSQVEGHPNIVRAYDFFKDPDSDDTYYLALELIDGRMLREIMDEEEVTLAQGARYLTPVVDALAYCHQRGIIHRNLTPYSIYVTDDGQVKVGDFDFARVPAIGQTITKTGQVLVESKYIAPEQLDDPRGSGARADLYSLGAVWYDLLFRRPEDEPVRLAIIEKSDLPDDARHLLRSLLAPRPADRPTSAAEVKDWFELLADKE